MGFLSFLFGGQGVKTPSVGFEEAMGFRLGDIVNRKIDSRCTSFETGGLVGYQVEPCQKIYEGLIHKVYLGQTTKRVVRLEAQKLYETEDQATGALTNVIEYAEKVYGFKRVLVVDAKFKKAWRVETGFAGKYVTVEKSYNDWGKMYSVLIKIEDDGLASVLEQERDASSCFRFR